MECFRNDGTIVGNGVDGVHESYSGMFYVNANIGLINPPPPEGQNSTL